MSVRLAIRGFVGRRVVFEDRVDMPDGELGDLLPRLAKKHAEMLLQHKLHMIEIEFLDEENPLGRFFRFGTDRSGMVMPMEINLDKPS